ncbi:unnamed protein product [Arctogadus glacialis]
MKETGNPVLPPSPLLGSGMAWKLISMRLPHISSDGVSSQSSVRSLGPLFTISPSPTLMAVVLTAAANLHIVAIYTSLSELHSSGAIVATRPFLPENNCGMVVLVCVTDVQKRVCTRERAGGLRDRGREVRMKEDTEESRETEMRAREEGTETDEEW